MKRTGSKQQEYMKWYKLAKKSAEVCKVCVVSGTCEAAVQTEDWLKRVVGG